MSVTMFAKPILNAVPGTIGMNDSIMFTTTAIAIMMDSVTSFLTLNLFLLTLSHPLLLPQIQW